MHDATLYSHVLQTPFPSTTTEQERLEFQRGLGLINDLIKAQLHQFQTPYSPQRIPNEP